MISSDSSSHQRHYPPLPFLGDFNEPFISNAPQVLDKILGASKRKVGKFFVVVAEGVVSIPNGETLRFSTPRGRWIARKAYLKP